jgi:hypothetical protein
MLLDNGDKTFTAGSLDVICILKDVTTGRFHVAFFEEHPMPGPVTSVKDTKFVRLMSKYHHTEGADTIEGAKEQLKEMRAKFLIRDENVSEEPIDWNGELGIVWISPNWLNVEGGTFQSVNMKPAA